MSEERSKADIENAIRLLRAELKYPRKRRVETVQNKFFDRLDMDEQDVLRWEDEGGSPL